MRFSIKNIPNTYMQMCTMFIFDGFRLRSHLMVLFGVDKLLSWERIKVQLKTMIGCIRQKKANSSFSFSIEFDQCHHSAMIFNFMRNPNPQFTFWINICLSIHSTIAPFIPSILCMFCMPISCSVNHFLFGGFHF